MAPHYRRAGPSLGLLPAPASQYITGRTGRGSVGRQDTSAPLAHPGAPRLTDFTGTAGTLTPADIRLLGEAIELSRRSPISWRAYSVGAVLAAPDGSVIATGYSRERDPADHAEEVALAKAAERGWPDGGQPRSPGSGSPGSGSPGSGSPVPASVGSASQATLYSSLEPCLHRSSRSRPCAELILAAGLRRVVIPWLEPPVPAPGGGAAWLRDRGVTVIEAPSLAGRARAVNAHLLAV